MTPEQLISVLSRFLDEKPKAAQKFAEALEAELRGQEPELTSQRLIAAVTKAIEDEAEVIREYLEARTELYQAQALHAAAKRIVEREGRGSWPWPELEEAANAARRARDRIRELSEGTSERIDRLRVLWRLREELEAEGTYEDE